MYPIVYQFLPSAFSSRPLTVSSYIPSFTIIPVFPSSEFVIDCIVFVMVWLLVLLPLSELLLQSIPKLWNIMPVSLSLL